MIVVTIFSVFYSFFLKLNLHFLCICALISLSADWALLDCVIDRKVRDIIFKAILSPSERYQNIQNNPEYNSVLPFRIILKNFVVNMLKILMIRSIFFFTKKIFISVKMFLVSSTIIGYEINSAWFIDEI